jgi:hypothetical protein
VDSAIDGAASGGAPGQVAGERRMGARVAE